MTYDAFMPRSRCLRCLRVIKIRHEGQQYGPVCEKKVEVEERLKDVWDHTRKICADAYSYGKFIICDNNDCRVMLSHAQKVLTKEYRCDNEKSFYFGTKIEKPLKHLIDCVFAERTNITCKQCTFRIEY